MVIKYSLIGKRVASRRRQLKLTQAQLAEKTELTSKYISNIETSHSLPSIESLMQLCAALDVTPNYLLFGISEKQETTKLDEVNRLLSTCTPQQLEKVIEFIEFITNRS
ncbi:MAG TPA: helix-turn-helix domain-containing protein [Firmicutes bacterium]|nr:helix-turn-helix domain-containing protein [Bacillota bacterium]